MSTTDQPRAEQPLQRSRRDLIATAVIALVALLLFLIAWFSAPIRSAELQRADAEHVAEAPLAYIPASATETFRASHGPLPGVTKPVVTQGLVISHDGRTITAHDPAGEVVWSYTHGAELCSLAEAWDKVVATFRTNVGCGDVVALSATTGEYAGTRSSTAPDHPVAVRSNDRVGILDTERVELWRSDLVRTVEYGAVEAKQEPDMQPHEGCTITSALTRTELFVITEVCPDDPSLTWLRFQEATPEDSREPELIHNVSLPDPNARLVAVGQEAAAVYAPGPSPSLISYTKDGVETERREVAEASAFDLSQAPSAPVIADLPHHMTWFDGERLYLFTPSELRVEHVLEDALGTGVAVADRLLYPTAEGYSVFDWSLGVVEKTIPVDREGYSGPVSVGLLGSTLVELRDQEIVGFELA